MKIETVSTIIAAFAFILSVVNTWWILWRDRVRVRVVFDRQNENSPVEIRNLSYMPVNLSRVRLSLHRSKKKPTIPVHTTIDSCDSLPRRLEPRSSVLVRFERFSEKSIMQIKNRKNGYILVETSCGRLFCKKFIVDVDIQRWPVV